MNTGCLVWEVVFDVVFSASSGSIPYAKTEENKIGLVITSGNSLNDVTLAIQSGLNNQTKLDKLRSAKFIGFILNSKSE